MCVLQGLVRREPRPLRDGEIELGQEVLGCCGSLVWLGLVVEASALA